MYFSFCISVGSYKSCGKICYHLRIDNIQPVLYKRFFRCNNCFLLLVYTIHLSLSTDLVDPPPPDGKHLYETPVSLTICKNKTEEQINKLIDFKLKIKKYAFLTRQNIIIRAYVFSYL